MKIALFTDTYPPQINGVATSTYNLAKTLRRHGNEVLVVTTTSNDKADANEFQYNEGIVRIPGLYLKKMYGYRLPWVFNSKAFEIVKAFDPDIIHDQTDSTVGQFAKICARRLNLPIVYTYHTQIEDYTYYVTKGYLDRAAKSIVRSYSLGLTKYFTEFITPSIKTKEMIRFYGADNYVSVIPTGIDFSLFKQENLNPKEIDALREKYGIDKNDFVFLILGRLAQEKSMDVSLKGIKEFIKMHPEINTKVLIVGGGPYLNALEVLVNELEMQEIVRFVGPVSADKVPYYYHLASIYTSASLTETQGLTFMEAMASGAIVIARFDDNLTGVIEDNETGFFFTDESLFEKKAYKVYQMNETEKNRIREGAYKIIEQYSIDTFYKNIIGVYNRGIKAYW